MGLYFVLGDSGARSWFNGKPAGGGGGGGGGGGYSKNVIRGGSYPRAKPLRFFSRNIQF